VSLDPKFKHPWTNGQVEIFNKTIKNATTKTYHYETVDELKQHLMSYLLYYNHQKKLKALKFKTPYTILLEKFDSSPELFKDNLYLKFRGLNIQKNVVNLYKNRDVEFRGFRQT